MAGSGDYGDDGDERDNRDNRDGRDNRDERDERDNNEVGYHLSLWSLRLCVSVVSNFSVVSASLLSPHNTITPLPPLLCALWRYGVTHSKRTVTNCHTRPPTPVTIVTLSLFESNTRL